MKTNRGKIIVIWGLLDIAALAWFLSWRIMHGQIPFYSDIQNALSSDESFGAPFFIILTIISLSFYLSLSLSGMFFLRRKKIGAILSYIQTPFRLVTLIPPSIFFILWPVKYIFDDPRATTTLIVAALLMLCSEAIKLSTVIPWHKNTAVASQCT